jgi:uncharacterized membrane protein
MACAFEAGEENHMKTLGTIATLTLVSVLCGAIACNRSDRDDESPPSMQKPGEPATAHPGDPATPPASDESRATFTSAKDEFVAATQRRIDQLSRQTDELQQSMDELGEDARVKAQAALADLRAQRDAASAAMARARDASADTWDDVRSSTDEQISKFESAYNRLLESMKTE